MFLAPSSLITTTSALRSGQKDLVAYIEENCNRLDTVDPQIQAFLPEQGRYARLLKEAAELQARFPDPTQRPPLYGVLLGVKDVFLTDGFLTHAGSQLPPELFQGPEASCVTMLRKAGALILGKTISTEFAWAEPGPTRNPHNLEHTPGGSSSGSAAAVAAGLCPFALGTQTVGSVIRPAAFCGIVGFKPTYGRIPTDGVVPCATSLDTVGFFAQSVDGIALIASIICKDWQEKHTERLPILGVPDGPYLNQASPEALVALGLQLQRLEEAGYTVRHVKALDDIEAINYRNSRLVFAEMALAHAEWFTLYEPLYRPRTSAAIREGQTVSAEELAICRAGRTQLRQELETTMTSAGIDLWVCPAAPGAAPYGITTTGNPIINLPWTHAGMPVITLPGFATNGLPLGLQVIGRAMEDERLVAWAEGMANLI